MKETQRFKNPQWLAQPAESFWEDSERRRWIQFYNESISHILKNLGLIDDIQADSLAKNLWHSANADEKIIEHQLRKYKEYKSLQDDIQKFVFA